MENRSIRIAICDDLAGAVRELEKLIRLCLQKSGHTADIITFMSGQELVLHAPEPDILFLDIDMPEMDGIETGKRVHRVNENCKIIMATGREDRFKETYTINAFRLRRIKKQSYATGNELLDIIVNYYFDDLESVDVCISGVCKKLPEINNIDFCIIFSNLIQNATEAVTKQKDEDGRKFIELKIEQGKKYIKFSLKNSTSQSVMLNQAGGRRTSKQM